MLTITCMMSPQEDYFYTMGGPIKYCTNKNKQIMLRVAPAQGYRDFIFRLLQAGCDNMLHGCDKAARILQPCHNLVIFVWVVQHYSFFFMA